MVLEKNGEEQWGNGLWSGLEQLLRATWKSYSLEIYVNTKSGKGAPPNKNLLKAPSSSVTPLARSDAQ